MLPRPSCKSHPIYTLFCIYNFAQQTSRLPEACHEVNLCLPSPQRVPCQATAIFCLRTCMLEAYSAIIEALPCLSSVLIRFLSLTGEDALANLSIENTEAGNITGHVRICSECEFYTRRWTSPCTAIYGDVRRRIWAMFGGCQPLLVTLTNFALYFTWVVLNRQYKAQNL
jgi:hypothetical protein